MIRLNIEKTFCKDIPVIIVHPSGESLGPAVFYHGWSSRGEYQLSKAAVLAANGYTVYLPDAINHGMRNQLCDYYKVEDYQVFWETLFQNVNEFPKLVEFIRNRETEKIVICGHSMGGMTVLGIASRYADDLKAVVSFNGSGDWLLTHLFMQARFGVYMKRDWEMYGKIENQSPLAHIKDMTGIPILLTNGESDTSIDPRAQAHFYESLKDGGGCVERITYPGLGHFVTTNMLDDAMNWVDSLKLK